MPYVLLDIPRTPEAQEPPGKPGHPHTSDTIRAPLCPIPTLTSPRITERPELEVSGFKVGKSELTRSQIA